MRPSLLLTLALGIPGLGPPLGAADLEALREEIRAPELRPEAAVLVENLELETGLATLHLRRSRPRPGPAGASRPAGPPGTRRHGVSSGQSLAVRSRKRTGLSAS